MKEVIQLVETHVKEVCASQLIFVDDSSASNNLTWVWINKLVEEVISMNFQIFNFINILINFFNFSFQTVVWSGWIVEPPLLLHQMSFTDPVIMEQLRNKDEQIGHLEIQHATFHGKMVEQKLKWWNKELKWQKLRRRASSQWINWSGYFLMSSFFLSLKNFNVVFNFIYFLFMYNICMSFRFLFFINNYKVNYKKFLQ